MLKKYGHGQRILTFLTALLLLSLLISGCSGQGVKPENQQVQNQTITLYFVKNTPTDFWLVPELRDIPQQPNMPKAALEELIKGPTDPALNGFIPKATRVIDVTVKDFIAYPNFSQDITRMSVGSSGEALAIAAIANTLIKFPGVEKVRILVDGQPVETLAGHVDLTEPVGRNENQLKLE
ncbi:MAG: GerMN domain-containing protein [Bacillota bacterium]